MSTLFVSGATGQLGRSVLAHLASTGHTVIAGTRDPSKLADVGVEVRRFDYEDVDSVRAALEGVDRALFISSDAVGSRAPGQVAAVKAAAEVGVKHVLYTSVVNAQLPEMAISADHRATEEAIRANFDSYTLLRNNLYMDLVLASLEPATATGKLFTARADGKVAYVTREDCARAAAAALADDSDAARVLDITGPEAVSGDDVAAALSEKIGKPVEHAPLSAADFQAGLEQSGVPAAYASVFVDFDLSAARGLLGNVSPAVQDLTGEPGLTLQAFLSTV